MGLSDWLFATTAVFLVAFFLYAELRRGRGTIRGVFLDVLPESIPTLGLLAQRARVRLLDGTEAIAVVSGCVLCQGRFARGDVVEMTRIGADLVLRSPRAVPLARACGSPEE